MSDLNNNGEIDKEEFKKVMALMHTHNRQGAHQPDGLRIGLKEFKNFSELWTRFRPPSLAMFSHGKVNGLLTKPDIQRAAHQVCGISLTDNVVNMIFYVFDTNRDGRLSTDKFLRVLQTQERGVSLPTEAGFREFLSCLWNCTNICFYSKILL